VLIDRADRLRFGMRKDGEVRRVNEVPGVPSERGPRGARGAALQASAGTRSARTSRSKSAFPWARAWAAAARMPQRPCASEPLVVRGLGRGGCGPWARARGGRALLPLTAARPGSRASGSGCSRSTWPALWYAVLDPAGGVPTRDVFAAAELTRNTEPLKMEDFSARAGASASSNDLEPVVVARHPVVGEHLEWLGRHGKARMTGSGKLRLRALRAPRGRAAGDRRAAGRNAGICRARARGASAARVARLGE
jgi:4-diphosphocytidyl-2-C-methyl-D-erythritol kinase